VNEFALVQCYVFSQSGFEELQIRV